MNTMINRIVLFCWLLGTVSPLARAADWKVGTPIVTYFAGPAMSESVAKQMADGGFNVVWCGEKDLNLLQKHGLRGMMHDGLLSPATMDSPEKVKQLDGLIDRIKNHPAMYSYYIIDEPSAAAFAGLGKLTAHIRQRDPAHLPYINLFPTYASNEQLGTKGAVVPAYQEYLKRFVETVKPMLLSYDNYQFMKGSDRKDYFQNLDLMRKESQKTGIPFLNIVQAASWAPDVRVPVAEEMRYLVYTTAAYGAQGISYYVYQAANHTGGMTNAGGSPTAIYDAVKVLNPEFVSIVSQLQPLRSTGVYHTAMKEAGCEPVRANAAFQMDASASKVKERGLLLGNFGNGENANHVLVVNLDYKSEVSATFVGPGELESFDASTGKWSKTGGKRAEIRLPPGGGKLLRVAK